MRKVLYLVVALLIQQAGIAQFITASSIGCVAFQGVESNSTSIQFNSNSKCLILQTGIYLYEKDKKSGPFQTVCLEHAKESFVTVVGYPNPVINKLTIKTLSNSVNAENYHVSIFTVAGVKLFQKTITEEELLLGFQIDCSNYSAGSYVVFLDSKKYSNQYQFIKRHAN